MFCFHLHTHYTNRFNLRNCLLTIPCFQINMNGYVTFDVRFRQWWSSFFPLTGTWQKFVMLAPFWGDLDSHLRIPGESEVWYQFYQQPFGAILGTQVTSIIERATHDVRTFRGDTGFTASTVIVITWHNMKPYWQSWWTRWEVGFSLYNPAT